MPRRHHGMHHDLDGKKRYGRRMMTGIEREIMKEIEEELKREEEKEINERIMGKILEKIIRESDLDEESRKNIEEEIKIEGLAAESHNYDMRQLGHPNY